MEKPHDCPLSPKLLDLLRLCSRHDTTQTKELAKITATSRHTIDDKFKKINKKLGTQKRDAALRLAQSRGWLSTQISEETLSGSVEESVSRKESEYPNFGVLQVSAASVYNLSAHGLPIPWPNLSNPAEPGESHKSIAERYEIVGIVVREKGTSRISRMNIEDREEFVDLVAQAVIDKIEERDRITGLVHLVVQRVIEIQKEEAEAKALAAAEGVETDGYESSEAS